MKSNWPLASPLFALLVIFLLGWGIASSLFPGQVYANSTIMRIVFLVIGAQTCGILVSFVGLPGEKRNASDFIWKAKRNQLLNAHFTSSRHAWNDWLRWWVCTQNIVDESYRTNDSHFNPPTVLYKNVGWGNFEGYEKLEAVLRWDAFLRLWKCCNISKARRSRTEPSKRDFNDFALWVSRFDFFWDVKRCRVRYPTLEDSFVNS